MYVEAISVTIIGNLYTPKLYSVLIYFLKHADQASFTKSRFINVKYGMFILLRKIYIDIILPCLAVDVIGAKIFKNKYLQLEFLAPYLGA